MLAAAESAGDGVQWWLHDPRIVPSGYLTINIYHQLLYNGGIIGYSWWLSNLT
jgi:hypothetical protein